MAKEIRVALILDTSNFRRNLNTATNDLNRVEGATTNLGRSADAAGGKLSNMFRGLATAAALNQIISYSDQITTLQNKLAAFSSSQEEANAGLAAITGIAERSRGAIGDVGDLYVKISNNAEQMGVTQQQAAQITETFAKALKVGGAAAAQASSATLQFSQAMGSGVLRGEEFNAVYEASPDTMNKLAAALGVPIKDMRKLAEEGALTSEVVAAGFLRMGAEVEEQFAKTTPTISESFTAVANNLMLLLNNIEQATGLFSGFANAIKFVADNLLLAGGVALVAFGPQLIGAIKTATMAMRAFALSNPFTAIALAIGVVIAYIANLAERTGGLGNAFKTMGNAAIGVINSLFNGFTAYFRFMGNALAALAKAFVVAINPFSDQNAKTVLMQGLTGAVKSAQNALNSSGPISFRFKLDPVDSTPAAAATANLPAIPALTPKGKDKARGRSDAERLALREAKLRIDELDAAEDLLLTINNQTDALRRKFDVELESIGLSQRQRELAEQLRAADEKRREDIIKIQQLQRLTLDEQQTKISEINAAYQRQTAEITAGNEELAQRRFVTEELLGFVQRDLAAMQRYREETDRIKAQAQAALLPTEVQRRAFMESFELAARYDKEIAALDVKRQQSRDELEKKQLATQMNNLRAARDLEMGYLNELQGVREEDFKRRMSFSEGLAQAQRELTEGLMNEAALAQRLFQQATDGFANSILAFVETGKLSFKDLFRTLMAEVIKVQASKLFNNLFGQEGVVGSIIGSIFGKRAVGGPVMATKPYLVGERGPELFVPSGPGTVVANDKMGGGGITQVTYNIQAVDAASFKQLLARDPEFLYSVSQAGARRLPR